MGLSVNFVAFMHRMSVKFVKWLVVQCGFTDFFDDLLIYRQPQTMTIETTNHCNLLCPICGRAKMQRHPRHMSFEEFKKIIEQIPTLNTVILHNLGEPFLNSDIFDIITYAYKRNLHTILSTNATILPINKILHSGLSSITLCLEGASKESHEKYRVGSKFEEVKRNIELFCKEKTRNNAHIHVILQTLITKYNESEIHDLIKLAKTLAVDELRLKFISLSLGEIDNQSDLDSRAMEWLPKRSSYRKYHYEHGHVRRIKPSKKYCFSSLSPVVLSNGEVTVCCLDIDGRYTMGNIFQKPFNKIFHSKRAKLLRRESIHRRLPLCKTCTIGEPGQIVL